MIIIQTTITINFEKEYQLKRFIDILAWMELCGDTGHCTDFLVVMDGDGTARPKFVIEDRDLHARFIETRKKFIQGEFKTYPNYRCDAKKHDIAFCID